MSRMVNHLCGMFANPIAMRLIFVVVAIEIACGNLLSAELKPSDSSVAALEKWQNSVDESDKPNPDDPEYQALVSRPDADLLFLQSIHHTKDPVRRLSTAALQQLKTDRSFRVLVAGLDSENMFFRQRCLTALAGYKEPRCVPHLLKVLSSDKDLSLRQVAAYELQVFDDPRVREALLDSLHENDRIALNAAYSLGVLGESRAIKPTYELILRLKAYRSRDAAVRGFRMHRSKQIVPYYIDLIDKFETMTGTWDQFVYRRLDGDLARIAARVSHLIGPAPDTVEQWRDWWPRAAELYDDNLLPLTNVQDQQKHFPDDLYAMDLNKLRLTTEVDSKKFRPGEPIRLDIRLSNPTSDPYKIVLPKVPSGWNSTMAWGIRLSRINPVTSILEIDASGHYQGSYGGPPPFETLNPGGKFGDAICLQHWLKYNVWPLERGEYELKITFDSAVFPGIVATGPEKVGLLAAPPVRFQVVGDPMDDPETLLSAIGEKVDRPWLKSDLTSRRDSRQAEAWHFVYEYGDTRLKSILGKIAGPNSIGERYRNGRTLRDFRRRPSSRFP